MPTPTVCRSCASANLKELEAEINIHFPGLGRLDESPILVFPKLLVCLECGFTESALSETELHSLREGTRVSIAL